MIQAQARDLGGVRDGGRGIIVEGIAALRDQVQGRCTLVPIRSSNSLIRRRIRYSGR
ncbi:hypothetical protein SBDP1_40022 [Syntrophobacter sp. SbD1]|nr:hypothetical protein SBDP1_40022 [Syntrophobacter sp. SbD1]